MKYILLIAFYLASPGQETDVRIKVYPKTFQDVNECDFVRDDLVSQAKMSENRHFYEAQCFGVAP